MPRRLSLGLLAAVLAAAPAPAASRLTNVSVRSTAGSAGDTLIVGLTVSGTGSKQVLLRGIGPTLRGFGVSNAVTDPQLRLFDAGNAQVAANDNWSGASLATAAAAVGAFALPANSADAALLTSLRAGSYSAHLESKDGGGIALVEAYDVDSAGSSTHISNLAARSLSGTGADVLTVGFAIAGDSPKTVLIRAAGPALADFGVPEAMTNPQLRLFSSRQTELGSNDDWLTAAGWQAVFTGVGAFPLTTGSRDAAMLVRLPPGTYTAQAVGANNATGVALIEIYDVPNPPATSLVLLPVDNAGRPPEQFTGSTPPPSTNLGRVSTTPVPLTQVRPLYPFELRRAGVSGQVIIDFIVNTEGRVVNAYVLRATDSRFGESALAAVQQWTFRPGTVNGVPVNTHMQVPIIYELN